MAHTATAPNEAPRPTPSPDPEPIAAQADSVFLSTRVDRPTIHIEYHVPNSQPAQYKTGEFQIRNANELAIDKAIAASKVAAKLQRFEITQGADALDVLAQTSVEEAVEMSTSIRDVIGHINYNIPQFVLDQLPDMMLVEILSLFRAAPTK